MGDSIADRRAFEATRLAVSLAGSIIQRRPAETDVKGAIALVREIKKEIASVIDGVPSIAGAKLTKEQIEASIGDDHLVCFEDGKKLKLLKRRLKVKYGMTPEQYCQKWGLPPDYPMVARSYSKERSQMARKNGLGTKKKKAG